MNKFGTDVKYDGLKNDCPAPNNISKVVNWLLIYASVNCAIIGSVHGLPDGHQAIMMNKYCIIVKCTSHNKPQWNIYPNNLL